MFASCLLFLLTSLYSVLADSTLLDNELYGAFGGPGSPGPHLPRPRLPPGQIPKRAWIFADLPILMTWTLAYIACGITFVLWLTGWALRQWEDAVDRDDKGDGRDQNEEHVGLLQNACDTDAARNRGSQYGSVLQRSAETRI